MTPRNPRFRWRFTLAILVTWIGNATAASDVGMITRLAGSVVCQQEAASKDIPAKSFMKIYQNDRIVLDGGAEMQLVYFASGRKETWAGPLAVKVGKDGSAPENANAKPSEISEIPAMAAKEFGRISNQLHRSGSALVRGSSGAEVKPPPPIPLSEEEQKTIDFAHQVYDDMRKSAGPQDITPELYLFSFLADYDLYPDMARLIAIMKKKQPENAEIDTLASIIPAKYRP